MQSHSHAELRNELNKYKKKNVIYSENEQYCISMEKFGKRNLEHIYWVAANFREFYNQYNMMGWVLP